MPPSPTTLGLVVRDLTATCERYSQLRLAMLRKRDDAFEFVDIDYPAISNRGR